MPVREISFLFLRIRAYVRNGFRNRTDRLKRCQALQKQINAGRTDCGGDITAKILDEYEDLVRSLGLDPDKTIVLIPRPSRGQ